MQVSHETIYRSLFVQARGVLKKGLMAHLRTSHFGLICVVNLSGVYRRIKFLLNKKCIIGIQPP